MCDKISAWVKDFVQHEFYPFANITPKVNIIALSIDYFIEDHVYLTYLRNNIYISNIKK